MKVEEAIKFIEGHKVDYNGKTGYQGRVLEHKDDNIIKLYNDVITLLMRGSAFEKMFREVENMYGSSLTWDIEQKYFPS